MIKTDLRLQIKNILSEYKKNFSINFTNPLNYQIHRIEIPITKINILKWLRGQKNRVKIYWMDKNQDFEIAGIGATDIVSGDSINEYSSLFNRLKMNLSPDSKYLRYYGGIRFFQNDHYDEQWNYFKGYQFIIPRFEVFQEKQNIYFACNLIHKHNEDLEEELKSLLNQFEEISFEPPPLFDSEPVLLSTEILPELKEWKQMVNDILHLIECKVIEKVVLARRIKLDFTSEIDPYLILKKLKLFNSNSIFFAFQPHQQYCFIGATPELLYRRTKNQIYSEAIAGTRMRGSNQNMDKRLEQDLILSDKERREHLIVSNNVKKILEELCSKLKMINQISVLKLNNIQHLFSNFGGELKDNISDSEIISLLHPTPAVGGYPKKEALDQIAKREPFSRGWYGGPIGWLGYDESEFAVAIRVGLINENHLSLYSGAGIVSGSDSDLEWRELETKITNFIRVIKMKNLKLGKELKLDEKLF